MLTFAGYGGDLGPTKTQIAQIPLFRAAVDVRIFALCRPLPVAGQAVTNANPASLDHDRSGGP